MSRLLTIFVLLGGCARSEDVPTDDPVQLAPGELPADPWVTTGQAGDLTLIRQEASVTAGRFLRVAGVFGESLDGLKYPAVCAFGDRYCLPDDAELEVEYVNAGAFTTPPSSWLGDHLNIGEVDAQFTIHEASGIAGYRGFARADGLLFPEYGVSFAGGEWGDYADESAIRLPSGIERVQPSPEVPIELEGDTVVEFGWRTGGPGQMVLSVDTEDGSIVRLLEDDGTALLDTSDLRMGRPATVRLARIESLGTVEVGGNTLALHGVSEHAWCMYDTCDGEPIGDSSTVLQFEFCWSLTTCGDSLWTLHPDGTWTTVEGYTGSWTFDCCSRQLDLLFTSGTQYSGRVSDDGCVEGQMMSWSGNMGDWQGCLQ